MEPPPAVDGPEHLTLRLTVNSLELATQDQRDGPDRADAGADWDLVIDADRRGHGLQPRLIWQYRDLLLLFVRRDIVAFYKQTILGPAWLAIQPILTALIYWLVFGRIAGLSTDGRPPFLFYLLGVTLWNYFSESFSKTASVFRDQAALFSKVYFPRIIAPLSVVISNLFRFAIQFVLLLIVLAWYLWGDAVAMNWTVLLLPLVICNMALLGLSMGLIVSSLTTKYRDLMFLLQFGIQLLMFATPVIYPASQMSASLQAVLSWNPLYPLFELTRHGLLGAGSVSLPGMVYATLFAVGSLLAAASVFGKVERTMMDTV